MRRPERGLGAFARPHGRDGRADAPRLQAVTPEKLLLAAPRGYCAGVDRAVQTVERALELYGPPVYVRKEIVHNKHVVEQLRDRGAVFVDELDDSIPEGAVTVFSAHGVSPAVHADADRRGLRTIDATCPLVTKVHREAVKFAADGYTIVLIGHSGHEEVEGTMGEAPEHIVLVETEDDVDRLEVEDPTRIAYISQTTLSVDETNAISLVEVARDFGADSYLIDNETQIDEAWLDGKRVVGITSGASAPELLVQRLVEWFRQRGVTDVEEFQVVKEDVRFMLPKTIRQAIAAREAAPA